MGTTRRIASAAVTAALLALAAFAVTAGAQSGIKRSDYPTFDTSTAGGNWKSSTQKIGATCQLSPLTCPTPSYSSPAAGGQGGSGSYLRIGYTQLIPADADIVSTWTSDPFHYTGAEGKDPTELSLSLFRKFHCAAPGVDGCALVDLTTGNEVRYTVDVINSAGDVVAQPIDHRLARPTDRWTRVEESIHPDDLPNPGNYRIAIETEVTTTAQVMPDPNTFIGYDSVDLKAKFNPTEVPGGGGRQTIFKHWRRLIVKDKCPKSLNAHTCLINLVTFKRDYHGVHPTPHKTVRRRGHHPKKITLRVRPKYNDWARHLAHRHGRLHVHEKVKAHHHAISRNRTLRVVAFKKP